MAAALPAEWPDGLVIIRPYVYNDITARTTDQRTEWPGSLVVIRP